LDPTIATFGDATRHQLVSDIIRNHSTNHEEFRKSVLAGLDISSARDIIDLGCGFGFMAEEVALRASPRARVLGVDACSANSQPFHERIARTGREAEFACMKLERELPWPDRAFDVAICSYSLYFFIDALPEIARILKKDGILIAVTHGDQSFRGLFHAMGIRYEDSELSSVVDCFSAEKAESILKRCFGETERVDYPNALAFTHEHEKELMTYVRFKWPYLVQRGAKSDHVPEPIVAAVSRHLRDNGGILVEKTDACFRCRGPICR
jgi:SAM-dependent methyltransferase